MDVDFIAACPHGDEVGNSVVIQICRLDKLAEERTVEDKVALVIRTRAVIDEKLNVIFYDVGQIGDSVAVEIAGVDRPSIGQVLPQDRLHGEIALYIQEQVQSSVFGNDRHIGSVVSIEAGYCYPVGSGRERIK